MVLYDVVLYNFAIKIHNDNNNNNKNCKIHKLVSHYFSTIFGKLANIFSERLAICGHASSYLSRVYLDAWTLFYDKALRCFPKLPIDGAWGKGNGQ